MTPSTEVLDAHPGDRDQASRRGRVRETLEEVALSGDEAFLRRYPHQLSGGQQQRVAIAMAFANRPAVIVCDEPTTGLDVTTQAHVLETIRDLCRSHRVAALYISHDLAVVAELADRVAVMYAGRVVEQGSRAQIFAGPQHPYTRLLLGAVPDLAGRRAMVGIPGYAPLPGQRPAGCIFHPRCPMASDICRATFPPVARLKDGHQVRCYHHDQAAQQLAVQAASQPAARTPGEVVLDVGGVTAGYGARPVLHDITLTVARNECLAIVGESGSGKTTLARCVAGLHRRYSGEIRLGEQVLARAARQRTSQQRRQIQYIFQNPYASLNPRRTAGQTLARQIRLFGTVKRAALARRVDELLERVSLSAGAAGRYPDQLSGGERQRVAIARALAAEPTLLICDEVTSALDVSVQAAIIELLRELRDQAGLSLLFITHNLAVVRVIADRAIVMTEGRIVEAGPTAAILTDPADDYTRRLLANTPSIDAALTTPA